MSIEKSLLWFTTNRNIKFWYAVKDCALVKIRLDCGHKMPLTMLIKLKKETLIKRSTDR
jgi:hypothetical protein